MRILVVSSSLGRESLSRRGAELVTALLRSLGDEATYVDLRAVPPEALVMAGGPATELLPRALADLSGYDGYVLAMPIYHNAVSGIAKHVVDCLGESFAGKVVGLISGGGSERSTLAAHSLLAPLIQGCSAIVLPKLVHLSPGMAQAEWEERLGSFAQEMHRLLVRLGPAWRDGEEATSASLPTPCGGFMADDLADAGSR
jgi:NAD(P)H-dependent FMN reductase